MANPHQTTYTNGRLHGFQWKVTEDRKISAEILAAAHEGRQNLEFDSY